MDTSQDGEEDRWKDFLIETEWASLRLDVIKALPKFHSTIPAFSTPKEKLSELETLMKGWLIAKEKALVFTPEMAARALKILEPNLTETVSTDRGAHVTDGIITSRLAHKHDFNAFSHRIEELFEWHENEEIRQEKKAPYFAIIQSSGMGKTKLLHEFNQKCKERDLPYVCRLFHCGNHDEDIAKKDFDSVFNMHLRFDVNSSGSVMAVRKKLDSILSNLKSKHTQSMEKKRKVDCRETTEKVPIKVVLLFDEAQGFLNTVTVADVPEHALVFRSIRWWLREQHGDIHVVAVFAGTTAKLSNFFPRDEPVGGTSRVSERAYKNYDHKKPTHELDKTLFDPFFRLHTIGCLQQSSPTENTDFARAAMYGRPMFAYYEHKGELDEKKLADFAKRLVLSSSEYSKSPEACYSVLGTRVQMGVTHSYQLSEALISSGYACLVDFHSRHLAPKAHDARVAFMPDPVCAALAMLFMKEGKKFADFTGRNPNFWAEKAADAFQSQLCLPQKGDAGEVFAALYMLFCGDVLRFENRPAENAVMGIPPFAISLQEWVSLLRSGKRKSLGFVSKDAPVKQISVIQFCRNHLRSPKSFWNLDILKYLHTAGVGFYTFSMCPAIDLVASIRVGEKYYPLLVSVKNWATSTIKDLEKWRKGLQNFVLDNHTTGVDVVGLVILIGWETAPDWGTAQEPVTVDQTWSFSLDDFPGKDVYLSVKVPADDEFGISKALKGLNATSMEASEVYASHSFLIPHTCEGAQEFLRKNAPKAAKDKVDETIKALRGAVS